MTRLTLALLTIAASALLAPTSASAAWLFCVAESGSGADAWISDVFPAEQDREHMEAAMQAYLKRHGVTRPVAQCPAPKEDKTEMVNAQFVASEFQRKLGRKLHEMPAAEFEPRR